jgi:hypothetical protein
MNVIRFGFIVVSSFTSLTLTSDYTDLYAQLKKKDGFIPTQDCPITKKIEVIINNLPEPIKTIANAKLNYAAATKKKLPKELDGLLTLYTAPQKQTKDEKKRNKQKTNLIFKTRDLLRYLIRKSDIVKYYIHPTTLIAMSAFVEHQVLSTHGLTHDASPIKPIFNHKEEQAQIFSIKKKALTAAFPGIVLDNENYHRPLYKLLMLAFDIASTKREPNDFSIVSAYTESKQYHKKRGNFSTTPYTTLAAEIIKDMVVCSPEQALSYAEEFEKYASEMKI